MHWNGALYNGVLLNWQILGIVFSVTTMNSYIIFLSLIVGHLEKEHLYEFAKSVNINSSWWRFVVLITHKMVQHL